MISVMFKIFVGACAALMFWYAGMWSEAGNMKRAWISGVIGLAGVVSLAVTL